MKDKQAILSGILDCGIAAVVRGESTEPIMKAIQAVMKGGVTVIEVTFTVPDALHIIDVLSKEIPDDVILGAGTVLTPQLARDAIKKGAQFIVSPAMNIDVIRATLDLGKVVMPGALTPTEVVTGLQAGADMIKIFPITSMGPSYIKDLHGPLPGTKFIPTGGIDLSNAADYLKAGASALGVGGSLVNKKLMQEEKWDELTERAKAFRKIVLDVRNGA